MPYGSSADQINLRSASWVGAIKYGSSGYQWPDIEVNDSYPGSFVPVLTNKVLRTGGKSVFYKDKSSVYIPKVVYQKKRMGTTIVKKKRRVWLRRADGSWYRKTQVYDTVKPVFVKVPKTVFVKSKLLRPENVLVAPNNLTYEKKDWVTDPAYSSIGITTATEFPGDYGHYFEGHVNVFDMMKSQPYRDFAGGLMVNMADRFGSNEVVGGSFENPSSFGFAGLTVDEIQSCVNSARSKLYKKVKDEFPSYALTLAESGESIRTLKSIFKKGCALLFDLKRLDLKRLSGRVDGLTANDIAKQWLEFVYGIMPIVNDIADTMKLYNREARTWRKYSASAEIRAVRAVPFESGSLRGTESCSYRYQYRCSVVMDGTTFYNDLLAKTGFDDNPVDTIYQLVPFSFMLDWLIDIGGYLSSADVLSSGVIHYWETSIVDNNVEIHADHFPYGKYLRIVGPHVRNRQKQFRCNRQVFNTPPVMPTPSLKAVTDALSPSRLLNALSIFITLNPTLKKL